MARQIIVPNPDGIAALFWTEDGEDEYFIHSQVFNEDQATDASGTRRQRQIKSLVRSRRRRR